MPNVVLPHWINKQVELKLPETEGSLYHYLLELVRLNPQLEKYIFSNECNDMYPVTSTVLWLNEKEIPSTVTQWQQLTIGANDTLSIEPAIVGG